MARCGFHALCAIVLIVPMVDAKQCGQDYGDCHTSKCCSEPSSKCVKQNAYFSMCKPAGGSNGGSQGGGGRVMPWELCSADSTPETKAASDPTLYCFVVATPNTAEPGMIAAQHALKRGIFGCDAYEIFSNVSAEELFAGDDETIAALKDYTHVVDDNMTSKLVHGHLANAPLFQKAWRKAFGLKRYQQYDWTLKVDVDAVLLPSRLSQRLRGRPYKTISWDPGYPGEKLPFKAEFFLNSLKDFSGNNLHGPVELLSRGAMQLFEQGVDRCQKKVTVEEYGRLAVAEDYYLNKCLLRLGVPPVPAQTFGLLYDKYEYGKHWGKQFCGHVKLEWNDYNPKTYAVYHDYKNITGWMRCYNETQTAPCIDEESKLKALDAARKVFHGTNKTRRDEVLGLSDANTSGLAQFYETPMPHQVLLGKDRLITVSACIGFGMFVFISIGFIIGRRGRYQVLRSSAASRTDSNLLPAEHVEA